MDKKLREWLFFFSQINDMKPSVALLLLLHFLGIDLMKLKRIQSTKKKAGGKKTETMTGSALTALTPALCFDFHPTVSWHLHAVPAASSPMAAVLVFVWKSECHHGAHFSSVSHFLQDSSIYLTGTWEGLIHKCSCSNSQQVLETYRKHFVSPDCREAFLLIFPDWTSDCDAIMLEPTCTATLDLQMFYSSTTFLVMWCSQPTG